MKVEEDIPEAGSPSMETRGRQHPGDVTEMDHERDATRRHMLDLLATTSMRLGGHQPTSDPAYRGTPPAQFIKD
jgi:hypothetical protein